MEFSLNETQAMVQKMAREYATRVIAPVASAMDRLERFPRAELKGLAELGLMAVNVPVELGGAGAGPVAYALAMQEVARACAATAVTMAVTNMVGEIIAAFGTDTQKKKYCPRLASGEFVAGSFGLSEPEAGSDPGGMRTTAIEDGDEWVINGQKQWITSGAYAGVIVVWARTGDREKLPGHRGISCFLVEAGTPGLKIGKAEDKMGIRGSNTVGLTFDDCRVPSSALLGQLHGGFKIAMTALDGGRIGVSSQAIGIARAALEESVQYARDRRQFDKPLFEFQATQHKLADMQVDIDASHLLAMRAAWLKEHGRSFSREASMAKLYSTEMVQRVCNKAVQIHGGYGYIREFAAERHLRDARVTTIYEGTSEVQRIVIARSLLS
ncbi:MAG: acyl-CoA dehydrogenase family protein [Polyangiaceae bacterium]|nr:acyl-CoA dehydrogenase family protein [Polyangiaceae bacterium]